MSAADPSARQEYGTVVVVGGGCYGSYYVRQLHRASRANALMAREVVVVDRDRDCQVARELETSGESPLATRVLVGEWNEYFESYLTSAAESPSDYARDAIVPSPLMPHLMGEWLVRRARRRWPERELTVRPFERPPTVPWDRAGEPGTHYVSFATWMCPINCVEPRICPHTRETRTWSMPETLADYAREERDDGRPVAIATLFCRHRAFGVGMFDTAEVIAADNLISRTAGDRASIAVIGTVSHCHGALTRLIIGAPADSHVT